jgi:hypothetical protein
MIWEAIASTLGSTSILAVFKKARNKMSEKKYRKLLADAVTELIALEPNISKAEAKIRAAEALRSTPTEELITAQEILSKVKSYGAGTKYFRTSKKKSAKKGRKAKRRVKRHVAKKRTTKRTVRKSKKKK